MPFMNISQKTSVYIVNYETSMLMNKCPNQAIIAVDIPFVEAFLFLLTLTLRLGLDLLLLGSAALPSIPQVEPCLPSVRGPQDLQFCNQKLLSKAWPELGTRNRWEERPP